MGAKGQQEQELEQQQQPDVNDFDAAFSEASAATETQTKEEDADGAKQNEEAESAKVTADPASPAAEEQSEQQQEPAAAKDETEAQQPAKSEQQTDRTADDDEDDDGKWKARYLSLRGKFNQIVEKQKHKQPEQTDTEREPDPKAKAAADATVDDDDEQLLQELDEEMPLVGKAVRKLIEKQEKRILQQVGEQLAPVANTVRSDAEEKHFTAIMKAHQDFEEILAGDELYDYIEKQPSYIQSGMRAVLTQGETADVIDLFTRFKHDTGYGQKPDAKTGNESPKERQQLDQRRQKQIEDASAVVSKSGNSRPSTAGKAPAEDYDSAFEEAAKRSG